MPSPAMQDLLAAWMPQQRWFIDKGAADSFSVRILGQVPLAVQDPEAQALIVLVARAGEHESAYQVPLSLRSQPSSDLVHALIGELHADSDQPMWVYDGLHDGAFVSAWLSVIADESRTGDPDGVLVQGAAAVPGWPIDPDAPAGVLRGEQSNTSVIVGAESSQPLIIKAFRVVSAGMNPDVQVQTTLAAAGCTRIAAPAGWLEATWHDRTNQPCHGHLAYAAEFMTAAEDAWRVAVRAASRDESFVSPAFELGRATAEVHALMAQHLPTAQAGPQTLQDLADALIRRAAWALEHVPTLAFAGGSPDGPGDRERLLAAVSRAADVVRAAPPGQLQLVHGDYHLGQVLSSAERGWILLDFEGEPLRPLAQRLTPDLVQRDLAGMLRSFDYVAGHVQRQSRYQSGQQGAGRGSTAPAGDDQSERLAAWAVAARNGFLEGYRAAGGNIENDDPLLHALELDKALYEVVYETRNRPEWVDLPIRAVHRLIAER